MHPVCQQYFQVNFKQPCNSGFILVKIVLLNTVDFYCQEKSSRLCLFESWKKIILVKIICGNFFYLSNANQMDQPILNNQTLKQIWSDGHSWYVNIYQLMNINISSKKLFSFFWQAEKNTNLYHLYPPLQDYAPSSGTWPTGAMIQIQNTFFFHSIFTRTKTVFWTFQIEDISWQ